MITLRETDSKANRVEVDMYLWSGTPLLHTEYANQTRSLVRCRLDFFAGWLMIMTSLLLGSSDLLS